MLLFILEEKTETEDNNENGFVILQIFFIVTSSNAF